MSALDSLARLASILSLALLPAFVFPQPALADEGLRADKRELAVGESTTLHLDGVTGWFKTRWNDDPDGIVRIGGTSNTQATVTALKPGRVNITAKVLADSHKLELTVLDAPDKKDPKGGWHTKIEGMAKVLGFPDKYARIARMLAEVNDGSRVPHEFYADLARMGATMFDAIAVRSRLVDGDPAFARDVLGPTFSGGGTDVEMRLLSWRRKETLAAIDEVVKRFVEAGRVPSDGYSLIISHVGKWATQELSALTLTGDIDFSFVSNDVALAEAMKAAFAEVIKRRTGLDPIALDSVATAHGKAGLEVYIGKHGMAFAEEQMKINQLVDMNTGAKREIDIQDVALGLTVERAMAETFGKEVPKPAHNTEPGLSMEMVRHFGHDIVKTGIYDMGNAVVKAAKYLDRSYKSLAAAKGTPADPDLAKFAADITAWANTKPQTAALRENMVNRISEYLGSRPKVIFDEGTRKLVLTLDAGQIAAFHKKATEAMWKTVEQGSNTRTADIETRMRDLTDRKTRGDNVDEEVAKLRKDMVELIDMVEAEVKAFQDVEVPRVVIDNNARVRALSNILAGRFGAKALSEEELKDKKFVEELLKAEGQHGSEMRRKMTAAYIMERSIDAMMKSPEIAMSGVEKANQMLDFIDDGLLGPIRGETGFHDFEVEMNLLRQAALDPRQKPGVLRELTALKGRAALGVKATNKYLNDALQATAAGRQGMKFMMVYGLVDEMKSYRDAFNQDGWGGFATEIFRRRIPLGSAVEGYVMGNTYRAGWDVVTTLIPPLALPEAAWGLGTAIGTQTRATYWNEQLALFVDKLYDSATFKLEAMEQHDNAKVGVYRLVSVKYKGIPIDLSQFAAMRKNQVDALREQVGKGRLDWTAYKREFQGLTNWMEVDSVLQKTIADSDPGLALIEEMMNHPNVGPKLMDRLGEKGLVRWEEVKLGFITNLIKRLEDRKQADQALGAGMLPDLFLELRKAAAALEIEDAMLRALDAEVDTNNLKALMNWLWETKRNVLAQAPTESETTRAAQVVKKYLDTYKGIVKSRDDLLAALPAPAQRDGATRYLTTDLFLSGRADADQAAADVWVKHVGASVNAGNEALLAIKKEYLPNVALDDEDAQYLKRLFPRELWMKPYKDAGIARQKTWLLDRAIDHGKARNAILDEYKAWLEKQAPVQLTVTVLDSGKPVNGASGDLKPTDALGKPGAGKASGNLLVFGVPTGRYRLAIQAPGYGDASQEVLLGRNLNPAPKLTVSLTATDKKADGNLAGEIAAALKARDWKHLADRLDAEKKSDLKMKDVVAWQANIDALNEALQTLRKERLDWALAWKEYLDALNNIDSGVWDKLMRKVELKRGEVEERCWNGSSASEDSRKRTERCQKEGRKFEESCVGTWPDQHWEEMKRIRVAKQELPDAVQTLHSAGYFTQRAWFEAVEKLTEKYKLPFPYPKPVTPRLKYALGCADVDLPAGKKTPNDLSAIKVSVPAPGASLPFGKPVTLTASASGGKAPYSFSWSSGGSGARVAVTPRWAGEWTVTVTARDADGQTGEGSATLHVSAAKVKLLGTLPTVFYGGTATLSLPGAEPPSPAPDPCAGRGYTSHNPFDECATIKIDPSKAVSVAPQWDDANRPAKAFNPNVEYVPDPDREGASAPPAIKGKQVIWQSEPALTFQPPTSSDGKTKVTYERMGEVKLWCEIQEQIEGAFHTVGECDQETIKVIAPKFGIRFSPPEGQGRIGQDIRAQVSSQPGVADNLIDFRWFDPPTSNRMELSSNAREIGFRIKDAKPVVLKALARVPHHGDEIAEISATYTGQAYQVKAWAVEPGTRPMMWDANKGGLVPVPKGSYTTHERIPLSAEIQGGAPDGVRWEWTVNDGTSISNPISRTPTVSRSSAGGISARVEARDGEGALLGGGEVSLSVIEVSTAPPTPTEPTPTLTPDNRAPERGQSVAISVEVSGGKPPYRYTWQGAQGSGARVTVTPAKPGNLAVSVTVRDSKGKSGSASVTLEVRENQADRDQAEATRLGEQARAQLRQGDLPGAIQSARQAQRHDPAAARAVAAEVADAAKKTGWNDVHQRDFARAVPNLEAAHELAPGDKDTEGKLNQARRFAQAWPQVEARAREFDARMAEKKLWSAQKILLEMQDLQHEMSGGMANPLSKKVMDDFNAGMAEYNRFMREVEATHTRTFKEQDWRAMLDNSETALRREHNPANEKVLKGNVDFAKQMLREQAAKPVRNIAGTWAINGNGYLGKLEISGPGERLSGRVWYDLHGRWEELNDVRFDGRALTFTRPIAGATQRYTGVLSGDRFSGGFTQEGTSTNYSWSANLKEAASQATASTGSDGARLSLERALFKPGEAITVRFTALATWPDNAWIGILPSRIPHGSESENDRHDVAYQYLNKRASGTLTFTAPGVGDWDLRMHDTDSNGKEVASVSFKVGAAVIADSGVLGLAPDKTAYAPGEAISLRFGGIDKPAAKDWIGLYSAGLPNEKYGEWHYLNGQAGGTLQFKAPATPGAYEFRLFLNWPAGGYKDVARSQPIQVAASAASAGAVAGGGLIAAYALDGDARDGSGNNRHGTAQGVKATSDRFGRVGGAMQFDGRSYIELPIDINPAIYPRLTFTAWVRADEINPIRQVMSHDDGGYDRSLGIDYRGGGAGWSLFTGSGGVLGFKPVDKGRWTFVAGVWDQPARKARLHVDAAVYEKSGESGGSGHKLNLGRNPGYGEYFVGAIDDVRIYDRALDAREIAALGVGSEAIPKAGGLAGAWSINANGYTGKLEFSESGGRLSGRVWFDAHRVWEDLRDISFDGRALRFLRPGPGQHYTGTLSGNEVRGTFDGGGTWNWVITRVGPAPEPDNGGRGYTAQPPRPANSALPPEAASLLEQVDAIKDTWKGLKGLFGK